MPAPNNRASLGCGTLILIALIVMIFGNSNRHGDDQTERQLADLRSEISNLKAEVENQSATLTQIKKSLDEIKKLAAQPRPQVVTPELESPPSLPEN